MNQGIIFRESLAHVARRQLRVIIIGPGIAFKKSFIKPSNMKSEQIRN